MVLYIIKTFCFFRRRDSLFQLRVERRWFELASKGDFSLLLRRFVFCMAEASAKRVTGDEPQGAMGRVQTAGEAPARSCVVFLAKKSFSWHGPIFGLFKSWKRSILVPYCCKHCELWVDR